MNLNKWYGNRRARAFCGRLLQSTVYCEALLPVPLPAPLPSGLIAQMISYQQVLGIGYLFCSLQVLKCLCRSVFSSAEIKVFLFPEKETIFAENCFESYGFQYPTQPWTGMNLWV